MENNGRAVGPRRGRTTQPLSAARSAILERLRDQPEPLTLVSLVSATGLHENTVREHLTALVRRGLVHRHLAEPTGRGRPAWRYELSDDEPPASEYAGLAVALARVIARESDDPGRAATTAGEEWGRELAHDRGSTTHSPDTAHHQVLRLLDDLGFAPVPSRERPTEVRLTRCPLLEAAHRNPDVVCGVHLGIVRGVLIEHGADPTGSALVPFAEPGACLLLLPPTADELVRQPGPPE